PSGSPCSEVTRPVITAPCCAGSGLATRTTHATAAAPTSSRSNQGTRIIHLVREYGGEQTALARTACRAGARGMDGLDRLRPHIHDPRRPHPEVPSVTARQTLEALHQQRRRLIADWENRRYFIIEVTL